VQSYVKEATIAFTACRKLMPDPEFYADCIEQSFAELRDAAAKAIAKGDKAPTSIAKPAKAAPKAKPGTSKPAAKKGAARPRKAAKKS